MSFKWLLRVLTLRHPGGFGDFHKKTSSFRLLYQRPSSSADCARELFNGSNGSASLVDCIQKIFLLGVCGFFVSDVIGGGLLAHFAWPWAPILGVSISLKFLLETRLQSESFDTLDDLLRFRVQKL